MAKAMQYITQGYEMDAHAILEFCQIQKTSAK